MTPETYSKIEKLAEAAERKIYGFFGDTDEFEIEAGGLIAGIEHTAEYRTVDGGDCYCGIWERVTECVREYTRVAYLYNPETDEDETEAAAELEKLLNRPVKPARR